MTIADLAFATLIATAGAVASTAVAAWASKRFRIPGIAHQADSEQARLITTLQARLEIAEEDVKAANTKAEAAESKAEAAETQAAATEARRQSCEDEVGRLRGDVRALEGELLEVYRKTKTRPPHALTSRIADHRREDGP